MNPSSGVLLVGEGDFSFALALLDHHKQKIVATGLDSLEAVVAKYCDASSNLRKLRKRNVDCHHNIDATKLDEYEMLGRFDHVVFTHPHLGTEDCRAHFSLLAHFFACCKSRLAESGGAVHVTLASDQSKYWRIVEAAKRHEWQLVRETEFFDKAFAGYTRRRSHIGKSFRVRTSKTSHTLTFTSGNVDASPPWNTSFVKEEEHVCDVCGRRCFDEKGLAKHVEAAHSQGDKRFACDVCNEEFFDKASLRSHRFAKHNSDAEKILKPDWWQQQLRRDRNVEGDVAAEMCTVCGCPMMMTTTNSDGRHRRHIPLVPQESLERDNSVLLCTVCGRGFRDLRALSQHTLSSHPKPS